MPTYQNVSNATQTVTVHRPSASHDYVTEPMRFMNLYPSDLDYVDTSVLVLPVWLYVGSTPPPPPPPSESTNPNQGPAGPAGPQGDPGPAGANGIDGATWHTGSSAPSNSLGVDNDLYLNTTTDDVYKRISGSYVLIGNIRGANGAAGHDSTVAGPAGHDGAAGADGKTLLSGVINPTTEGVDGDFYINTATNHIFGPKASGTWPTGVSIVGPKGDKGDQGDIGLSGADSTVAGPAGHDGADGKTILSGVIDPTTEGVDGDFYINTATNHIFGPKAGTWPAGVSLIGPQGDAGPAGADSTVAGPKGDKGDQGDSGPAGMAFAIVKSYLSVADLLADTTPSGIVAGQYAIINSGHVNNSDNARLYVWTGSAYTFIVDMSGPSGGGTILTVTYDGNGNDSGAAPVDTIPYAWGETAIVQSAGNLSLTSYSFAGWNTAANGSGSTYNPADTFTIYGNVTLYAQWAT